MTGVGSEELGSELGTCTRCRVRTAVTPCKLERAATVSDPTPINTTLCASCIATLPTLRITRLARTPELTWRAA